MSTAEQGVDPWNLHRRSATLPEADKGAVFRVSLRHMAREYPTSLAEFGLLHGVGEKKLNEFGELFTKSVATYLEANEKKSFSEA